MKRNPTVLLIAGLALAGAQAAGATVVTRGPYLQMPTSSGITVRWRTDVATSSQVRYGSLPGMLTSNVDDATLTTEHVVTVSGLLFGTQYYYSVGEIGTPLAGDDVNHYFRTAPAPGTAVPMRLWSIGDAGFVGADLDAVRDAYAVFAGTSAADLFLLLGDNAYISGTDAQYQSAVFDEHQVMLRTTPVWSVFGNHEALSANSPAQTGPYFDIFSFPTAAEVGGIASGTEAYYSFDYGNVHFIVLDSEQAPAMAGTPQLIWLEADLQDAVMNDPDWIVAMWHRPPYTKGQFHDSDVEVNEVRMRQFAVPILEDYGVDVVLGGHSHTYERSYFIDNHYGLSSTFTSANQVEPGDGDPAGDGAYRKEVVGPSPHAGAVYVVNGSGSEVRVITASHPAILLGLEELGSLVIDIDGNTFTAQFLNSSTQVKDTFRIVKGTTCAPAPAMGCAAAPKARMTVKNNADPSKDKWQWKWKQGTINAPDFGDPTAQADLSMCVYDNSGLRFGGSILHGAPEWTSTSSGFRYVDGTAARYGFRKIKVKTAGGGILAQAKGPNSGIASANMFPPVRVQMMNLDNGTCWESVFASAKKQTDDKFVGEIP